MAYSIGSVCPRCGSSIEGLERCQKCYRRAEAEAPDKKQDKPAKKNV